MPDRDRPLPAHHVEIDFPRYLWSRREYFQRHPAGIAAADQPIVGDGKRAGLAEFQAQHAGSALIAAQPDIRHLSGSGRSETAGDMNSRWIAVPRYRWRTVECDVYAKSGSEQQREKEATHPSLRYRLAETGLRFDCSYRRYDRLADPHGLPVIGKLFSAVEADYIGVGAGRRSSEPRVSPLRGDRKCRPLVGTAKQRIKDRLKHFVGPPSSI